MTSPDTVIKVAMEEVGYLEKSRSAYKADPSVIYEKTRGAGNDNITKYGYEMHLIYPATMDEFSYWCDSFVDWCFYKAYGVATAKALLCGHFDDYTVASAEQYKKKNAWYVSDGLPGDQVFFKNDTRICHTGLVYKVDSRYLYTVEGNTNNSAILERNGGCVVKKKYPKNYSKIAGYGRPKYDVPATCSIGDVNSNVRMLQKMLMRKGFALPRYGADGDFGNETFVAVKNFRIKNGIGSSGICDAICWNKLLH